MKNIKKETRPWGNFFVLESSSDYKIKKIEVNEGQRLSYQYHNKRAETWVIISGVCKVTINDVTNEFKEGDTIKIPLGAKHRIENIKNEKLVFIEIQTGEYFGEDDIVRIQDDYNRK